MNAPAVNLDVAEKFHNLRRRYFFVRIAIALAIVVASAVVGWIALATADYYWELGSGWRQIGLSALLLSTIGLIGWQVYNAIRSGQKRHFASTLENEFEDFGQRIRTVLDTVDGKVDGPEQMLSALGHQTLGRWETLSPSQLIPSGRLIGIAVSAGLACCLASGLLFSGSDWSKAMRRSLGSNVAYTQLMVQPGNTKVVEGQPLSVALDLIGRTNRDVMIRYRKVPLPADVLLEQESDASDQLDPVQRDLAATEPSSKASETDAEPDWIESDLAPFSDMESDRRRKFELQLGRAEQPVEYQFVTSVGSTEVFRIDVQPLIEAVRVETNVTPPEYTAS